MKEVNSVSDATNTYGEDIKLTTTDASTLYKTIITELEKGAGEPLYPGDERRIFGEALVPVFVALYNSLNDVGRQTLLRYARGEVLDAIGERQDVKRLEGTPAKTTMRFSVSTPQERNIIIPKWTKVAPDSENYFATDEIAVLQAGAYSVEVPTSAVSNGTKFNGYAAGTITTLVDLIPYIESVTNLTETAGGDDGEPYAALLDLVTDICKRNGIKRLVWSTSKNDRVNHLNGCNMTVHRDYANKSCPGDYLYNRHGQIAAEVNKRLGITDTGGSTGGQTSGNTETGLKVGDVVSFKGTQHYTSAAAKDAKTCKPGKATITAVAAGKAHPYHLKAVSGGGSTVYGWVNAADISTGSAGTATSYRVRTTADVLNIRKGPGTNYGVAGQIKGKGIYTIVAEAAGPGATKWGKLKSGAGWISLDYVTKL